MMDFGRQNGQGRTARTGAAAARWSVRTMPSLRGRRFLITGANSGIGYCASVELVRHGAEVVMACRDRRRGEEALARLRREAAGPESAIYGAELAELDLASLDSVRRLAEGKLQRGRPLAGVINNAAVMAPRKRKETRDGFELQFGTNVLGHFALTCSLLPLLELAPAARVVTISSIAHKRGTIDFDDLNAEKSYGPMEAYAQSKLANLMFAFELERRLRAAGKNTISVAAHPGVANTRLFQSGDFGVAERAARTVLGVAIGTFLNSDAEGAVPTLYAATAGSAEGGGYYGPQGFREMRGGDVGVAEIAAQALDEQAQKRLWEACEEMTGVGIEDSGTPQG